MNIHDVQVPDRPLVLATPADVDALESQLWITFPVGYREYVTQLGEGVLGGTLVRIYPPWRIEKELAVWRRRINKYWFWDKGREHLPKERALECVIVGDTVNGDELVFHPTRPDRLFVLPRGSGKIFQAGNDLLAAAEWMCGSGELVEPFAEREFEPFDSRLESAEGPEQATTVVDPEGESLDDLVELGEQWAERHSVRKMAQKDLKKHTGDDKKTTFLYEALVIKGKRPHVPGYLAAHRVDDKESGLEYAVFTWHKNADSCGFEFALNQANFAQLRKPRRGKLRQQPEAPDGAE